MDTAALVLILIGTYLLDSALKNRRPVELAKQVIQKPGSVRETLANAEGYTPSEQSAFDPNTPPVSGSGSGGGSASSWSATSTDATGAIAFAQQQIGKPYVWGGTGTNNSQGGYDCSGLVVSAYRSVGVSLPRTTAAMLASTKLQKITRSDLAAGDLVFPFAGHVQLYIGDGKIIEAPGRGRNVRMKTLGSVWQARRIPKEVTPV